MRIVCFWQRVRNREYKLDSNKLFLVKLYLTVFRYPVPRRRITTLDLYKALMDKNVIPSHSVYSINIEKISSMLT